MKPARKNIITWTGIDAENAVVGELVEITEEGVAVVDYPGNPRGPLPARSTVAAPLEGDVSAYLGRAVLITFEERNPALPIVVGFVRDTLFAPPANREETLPVQRPDQARVDGRTVRLDAEEEIVLCCGKSAIVLKKDGRVIVRGVEITSRATQCNKIKGGKVRIN